jgi:uncharacterized protein
LTDVHFSPHAGFHTSLASDELLRDSVTRLGREDYDFDVVVSDSVADGWPGDLAGRLLLTLGRLARAAHVPLSRPSALFERMLAATSGLGYFGAPLGAVVDEQQVACHGWVASAYFQFGVLSGDDRGPAAGMRVVDELLLPALSRLDDYPANRPALTGGAPAGAATETINGWLISTDTWCVLLSLNALVPAWEHSGREDIRDAIERLIATIDGIDLVSQRAQLHASLAAGRNAARFAELTGSTDALRVAADVYDAYVAHGRTLNWATYNWFDRSDTWTEPCAIVDSVGAALALWRLTGEDRYVHDVVAIERNGLAFAEKSDGSFGLDTIATAADPTISLVHPDARWCCTVRGAIGLMELRDRSVELRGDVLLIVLPRSGRLRDAGWDIELESQADGSAVRATVVRAPPGSSSPLIVDGPLVAGSVRLPPVTGGTVTVDLGLDSRVVELTGGSRLVIENGRILVPHGGATVPLSDLRGLLGEGSPLTLVHAAE